MTWDWSYFKSTEFVVAVVFFILGLIASVLASDFIRWRDRRSVQRHETKRKHSARKQELFEYRLQLARQEKFKAMLLFHRGNSLRVMSEVWEALGYLLMLGGSIGYFASTTLFLGGVEWRDFIPVAISVSLVIGGGYFHKQSEKRFYEARDLLDPVESILSDEDRPLLYPDVLLDPSKFKTSTQSDSPAAPVKK